jgi:hypothetical protein
MSKILNLLYSLSGSLLFFLNYFIARRVESRYEKSRGGRTCSRGRFGYKRIYEGQVILCINSIQSDCIILHDFIGFLELNCVVFWSPLYCPSSNKSRSEFEKAYATCLKLLSACLQSCIVMRDSSFEIASFFYLIPLKQVFISIIR